MATAFRAPRRHRFSREEYYAMAERGQFGTAKVELVRGEIFDLSPQQSRHAAIVSSTQVALEAAFGHRYVVRIQLPLTIGTDSEPEPDAAVVAGRPKDYLAAHPTSALLVVEVADSSLAYDLAEKAALYAEAGIPDYWVADVLSRRLHVHREPGPAGYMRIVALAPGERIRPLHAPPASIEVEVCDLLP